MGIFEVVIILLCIGVVLYFLPRVPYVDASMKTLARWIIIIATIVWLLLLTGVLQKLDVLKFPHV